MKRTRYQGVLNIVRFNPYFFITALVAGLLISTAIWTFSGRLSILLGLCLVALLYSLVVSLAVSHWIYDLSKNFINYHGSEIPLQTESLHG